jgi:hypothetical protein
MYNTLCSTHRLCSALPIAKVQNPCAEARQYLRRKQHVGCDRLRCERHGAHIAGADPTACFAFAFAVSLPLLTVSCASCVSLSTCALRGSWRELWLYHGSAKNMDLEIGLRLVFFFSRLDSTCLKVPYRSEDALRAVCPCRPKLELASIPSLAMSPKNAGSVPSALPFLLQVPTKGFRHHFPKERDWYQHHGS